LETDYQEFRRIQLLFTKHIYICDEFNKVIKTQKLMEVSELQQELANKNEHSTQLQKLNELIESPDINADDKIKLLLLYALRYEINSSNQILALTQKLINLGVDTEKVKLINAVLKYGGAQVRVGDLYSNRTFTAIGKSFLKSFQGVEHNLLAHKPLLNDILEQLAINKLPLPDYPCLLGGPKDNKVVDIIVFVIGGITYEEARFVHEMNVTKSLGGARIILGGTTIHNAKTFLAELEKFQKEAVV